MSDRLVVGIDVGSGSSKASVFDLFGRLRSVGRASYAPVMPAPGLAEYNAREVRAAAVHALAAAARGVETGTIEAIAVDAMMSGAVPIDAAGEPTAPYTTTLDTRFSRYLAAVQQSCGTSLRRLTGSTQATLGPKIAWIQEEFPEIAARTRKYVAAGSLVAAYLAGLDAEGAFIDPTYLWTTGLADAAARSWSPELCAAQHVDSGLLPHIVAPTHVVGQLSGEIAAQAGLRSGIPVVAGCGDQSAGFIGAGVAYLGTAADSAGTYAVLAGVTAGFAPSDAEDAPDLVPVGSGPAYNVLTTVIGGGLTRQWARDLFSSQLGSEPGESGEDTGPEARGVRFVPHLGGQAHPTRPGLRGAWLGLTWAHGPADLYQAVLQAIALDHAHGASRMREQYPDVTFESIVGYGGGAKSAHWNQIKADALGVRYESLGNAPVAGLGAAMLAAQGVGLVDDAAAVAAKAVTVERVFEPDPTRHERYVTMLPEYLKAVACVDQLS